MMKVVISKSYLSIFVNQRNFHTFDYIYSVDVWTNKDLRIVLLTFTRSRELPEQKWQILHDSFFICQCLPVCLRLEIFFTPKIGMVCIILLPDFSFPQMLVTFLFPWLWLYIKCSPRDRRKILFFYWLAKPHEFNTKIMFYSSSHLR